MFWPLQSRSEFSRVPENFQVPFSRVWVATSHFPQSGVVTPYAGPFKMFEKKLFDIHKLQLPKNLRVHPTFHVYILKPVTRGASRPNREHNSRPPLDLVHNEPKFEVEAVLKSRQLRRWKLEYLVKWKGYHPIEASWVNESDMEHAQEAIEEFHIRPAKKKHRLGWRHRLSFSGIGRHKKCTTSSCKWNKGLKTSKRLYHVK